MRCTAAMCRYRLRLAWGDNRRLTVQQNRGFVLVGFADETLLA